MTVFRTATLRTFFFAIFVGAKELIPDFFSLYGQTSSILVTV